MIFEAANYKQALQSVLEERRKTLGKIYTYQGMAKACRVQKTYLSRVFNGDAHLSDDQLYMAADFLGMNPEERQYVTLLHQYERSGLQPRKRLIQPQIEAVRKRNLKTASHLAVEQMSAEASDYSEYFINPMMQLVHAYLMVPKFAKDLTRLRQNLGLPNAELAKILARLSLLGFIRFHQDKYEVVKDSFHLSPESPIYQAYRKLLRLKALERLEKTAADDSYGISVVFTATEEVRRKVQSRFLAFLKEIEDEVRPAESAEVYQMNFDLFRWSSDGQ